MSQHRLFGEVLAEELHAIDLRRMYAKHGPSHLIAEMIAQERLSGPEPEQAQPGETDLERQSREDRDRANLDRAMRLAALDRDLVGVSLSGGGIRSATFALGVLQGLARMRLLKRIDYLSTVSGGGYIGSWLAAWIRREGIQAEPPVGAATVPATVPKDAVRNVELQLNPSRVAQAAVDRRPLKPSTVVDEEPEPIRHLRAFSNYLAPRPGLLTTDTWTLLGIYVRNFLLNQLILLPLTVAFILLVWFVVFLFGPNPLGDGTLRGFLFLGLLGWSFFLIGMELSKLYRGRTKFTKDPPNWLLKLGTWYLLRWTVRPLSSLNFHFLVIWPLVVTSVLACWLFGVSGPEGNQRLNWRMLADLINGFKLQAGGEAIANWEVNGKFVGSQALAFTIGFGLLHLVMHMLGMSVGLIADAIRLRTREEWSNRLTRDFIVLGGSLASGALGGFLFYLFWIGFLIPHHANPAALATFGPPVAMALFSAAVFAEVGLLGRYLEEDEREWWARVTAFLLTHALIWLVIFGTVVYVPRMVMMLDQKIHNTVTPTLIAGWIATSIGGAAAGRSGRTGGGGIGKKLLGVLVKLAPIVFLLGLLAIVSGLVKQIEFRFSSAAGQSIWLSDDFAVIHSGWPTLIVAILACVATYYVMNALVNANLFSLHAMYANRLTRCYLGASRRKEEWKTTWRNGVWHPGRGGAPTGSGGKVRSGQLITGFDFHDDIPLRSLRIGPPILDGSKDSQIKDEGYWGPFRLICTAMNLVAGQELAWQDRRAESFILTPLYCGSKSTGYRKLEESADQVLTLGRAMAISGAAIDPSIGSHQSASLTALMTIFNARLGWWMENPKIPGEWSAKSPRFAGLIWRELAGQTDENGTHVHLSDGGHFENLAVYELVRRRCRYIIACDAGQDDKSIYDDLAKLARLCRSDFGVRIELDTSPIDPDPKTRRGRWHCAIGQIHYEDVDPGEIPGILIYIKASLTGDEPSDVRNYAATNPDFPHQTTVDQFFDEAQFESYRALGHHIAGTIFNAAMNDAALEERNGRAPLTVLDHSEFRRGILQECKRENRELFSKLRSRWFPAPPEIEVSYGETARAFGILQGVMRSDRTLRSFSRDLNPELGQSGNRRMNGKAEHAGDDGHSDSKASRADRRSAELHMINQVIQVMEKAWMGVRLEGYPEHPMNRGWMNALRRVSRSKTLRRNWPIVRGGFDHEFVQFCERELGLPDGSPTPFRLVKNPAGEFEISVAGMPKVARGAIRVLSREFQREWPGVPDLVTSIERAQSLTLADKLPTAWIICSTRRDDANGTARPTFPMGAILAWRRDADSVPDGTEFELLTWIRGPYRNMGVGRECFASVLNDGTRFFERILDELRPSDSSQKISLIVRYPKTPPASRIIEKKLWLNFHYSHAFRVEGPVDIDSGRELIMRRHLSPRIH
ncbi:MAG: patatin-like phospholipase family protein [Isosphaeraceae bacterium]